MKYPPRDCEECGKEFIPRQYNTRFCSSRCGGKAWKKRNPDYRKNHFDMYNKPREAWKKANPLKHEIHKKVYHHLDEYPMDSECVFCGATEDLQRAHLDYEDDGHNYITACRACHWWMDYSRRKET
jgi:hypothetical protein